jgi:hypothetical protein
MTQHPRRGELPPHHRGDAHQPPGLAHQVAEQPQVQEVRLGRPLRDPLLKHEAGSEEDCRGHGEQVLHAQNLPRTGRSILLVGVSAAMPPSRAPGRRRHAAIADARPSP